MKKLILLSILFFTVCLAARAQETTNAKVLDDQKPISFGIVVDNSGSFRPLLDYVVKTTQALSNLMETNDEGFLVRFVDASKIETLQDLTGIRSELMSGADQMYIEGGHTDISEALRYSAKYLLKDGKNDRKILILVTDGDSTSAKESQADAIKYLKEKNVAVFIVSVALALEQNIRQSQKAMDSLAKETGGIVVTVDRKMTAQQAADAIIKAVRTPSAATNSNGK